MLYWLNTLRWRLARWIAPGAIVAAPLGGDGAYLHLREQNMSVWVPATTLEVSFMNDLKPFRDELGLANLLVSRHGTFSGTIGGT